MNRAVVADSKPTITDEMCIEAMPAFVDLVEIASAAGVAVEVTAVVGEEILMADVIDSMAEAGVAIAAAAEVAIVLERAREIP